MLSTLERKDRLMEERTCPYGMCDGSGLVACMEQVYFGEPHMALLGERGCECAQDMREEDAWEQDSPEKDEEEVNN